MVDDKVRAGVVVTGKVVAVDKDKAVVGVIIVDIVVVVVVIITVELEMAKVVCSILVLGFAVLIKGVEIVDSDEDPGTVECFVLVLVPREGVKLVVSEVETLVAIVLALKVIVSEELWTVEAVVLVLMKVVGFVVVAKELEKVESVVLVLIKVVGFVEVLVRLLVLGVLIKTGELVGANVELMVVLVLIKVVDFVVVVAEDDELGKVESLVLVLIKVDDFVVEDKVIVPVVVLGVLIKTGELVGANVELMVVISSVGL